MKQVDWPLDKRARASQDQSFVKNWLLTPPQPKSNRKIEVLKSYDQSYAREAFKSMDDEALQRLWATLKPEEIYEPAGLPSLNDPADVDGEAEAFLWDELLEQRRSRQMCDLRNYLGSGSHLVKHGRGAEGSRKDKVFRPSGGRGA